jgi:hypothetical protein
MVYRRSPATPPRLLLRIVTGAGTGALLTAAACGSSSPRCMGLCVDQPTDAGSTGERDANGEVFATGLAPNPDAGPSPDGG